MMDSWKLFVVEWRVLGFRRAVKDRLYWWWVCFWLLKLPFSQWDRFGLTGCLGYFELRDCIDFPLIGRWQSVRAYYRLKKIREENRLGLR